MSTITQETPQVKPDFCTIVYDRSARVYRVRNGSLIGEYPNGDEGRRAAELAALGHDGPEIFAEYEALVAEFGGVDGFEARARRAARLAQRGHVEAGRVLASDGSRFYRVKERSLIGLTCECEDFENGREARFYDRPHSAPTVDGQTYCKHIIARLIVDRLAAKKAAAQAEAQAIAAREWAEKEERRRLLPPGVGVARSIEDMLGYDSEALAAERAERARRRVKLPTAEESARGLAAVLKPGGGGPCARPFTAKINRF